MITAQAGGQSARESALRTIVRINEQIKAVIGDAFRVRMMSLNALILAKRAGQSAVGFGVLSNELRGFASELQGAMQGLQESTTGLLQAVTLNARAALSGRILARLPEQTLHRAGGMLARNRHRLDDRHAEVVHWRGKLASILEEVVRTVELGNVLARSTRIEAVYGGAHAPALTQVAVEFDAAITHIRQAIEHLRHLQRP